MIKKLLRITAVGLMLGLLAVGIWLARRHAARGGVQVTISKETTVITEPLRKDGYVDYIAALNRILGKDVTPENNALVAFWNAMGPAEVPQKDRTEYFRLLGVKSPAENGNHFILLKDFVQQQPGAAGLDAIDEQLGKAQERPWTKNDFPVLAAWLEANQTSLEMIIAASRRPRYYSPLLGDDSGRLMNVVLPASQEIRHAAQALSARAMLRLSEGKTDACWQDLLATHRLARLCGQGFCLVEALTAQSIDGAACRGDQAICQTVRLSAPDALRMRDEFSRLAPLPNVVDIVDRGERWGSLSAVVSVARGDATESNGFLEKMGNAITREVVDWDIPLRITNSWFDRAVEALRKPTLKEQHQALEEFNKQLRLMADAVGGGTASSLPHPPNGWSERVGQRIATLLFPAIDRVNDSARISAMRVELTKLSFSLAAYRSDNGSYPAELNALVPKYAAEIPPDVFNGGALRYINQDGGYVLYSVGRNGKDDGGRSADEDKEDKGWDDIVVRMPKSR
jgi:hypothetical protein